MRRNGKLIKGSTFGVTTEASSSSHQLPFVGGCQLLSFHGNPMLNPVVLECLVALCDIKDLLNYRLVCKLWRSLSLTRFRKETMVFIKEPTDTEEHSPSSPSNLEKWSKEVDLILEGKPFQSFRLTNVPFLSENSPIIQFWNDNGPWIRKLELVNCTVMSLEALKRVIFEQTPNLQELSFENVRSSELEVDGHAGENEGGTVTVQPNLNYLAVKMYLGDDEIPISWRLLFAHFPNVQRLVLNDLDFFHDTMELVDLLEVLEEMSRENKLHIKELSLKYLKIFGNEYSIDRFLQLPNLKLEVFHVHWDGRKGTAMDILPAALKLHGHTLKKLIVTRGWYKNPKNLQPSEIFPFQPNSLLNLSEIILEGGSICHNFHFLEQMPNLKVIRMDCGYQNMLEKTDLERIANVRLPNLLEASLPFSCNFSEESMQVFVKIMPNVEKFEACLTNESLRVLCLNWRNMRFLRIKPLWKAGSRKSVPEGTVDDEGITGILPGRETGKRLPNISDLKYLHTLDIFSYGTISDISVQNCFKKLPHLRSLEIHPPRKTSDGDLKLQFPHNEIRRFADR